MNIVVHCGIVWAYEIRCGWYWKLKPFPEAIKKITKDEFAPDQSHASVLKYVKENT